LKIAIETMTKREVSQFRIQPDYGFGPLGIPPRIPGGAVLLVIVEIEDFFPKKNSESLLVLEESCLKFESVYRAAAREHRRGNRWVKEKDMICAAKAFDRGVRLLIKVPLKDDIEQARQKPLLLNLLLNLAECSLLLKKPARACTACREALALDPLNFKALFRFGRAKRMLEDLEMAQELLQKALQQNPTSERVLRELSSLAQELEQAGVYILV
jgi:tetratricopeptide (TPR) repeat protein